MQSFDDDARTHGSSDGVTIIRALEAHQSWTSNDTIDALELGSIRIITLLTLGFRCSARRVDLSDPIYVGPHSDDDKIVVVTDVLIQGEQQYVVVWGQSVGCVAIFRQTFDYSSRRV